MRKYIESMLVKFPAFYRTILGYRRRAEYNVDKVIFLSTVRPDDVVCDVGADKGYYTVLFSNIVGSSGHVHAFEPIPSTFRKLSQYVHKQQLYDNTHLKNLELSAETFTKPANLLCSIRPAHNQRLEKLPIQL